MWLRLRSLLCFSFCIRCLLGFSQSKLEEMLPLELSSACDVVILSCDTFKVKPVTKKKYYLKQSFLSLSKSLQVSDKTISLKVVINDDVLPLEQLDVLLDEVGFTLYIDKMGCRKFKNNLVFLWEGKGAIGISLRGYSKRQFLLERCLEIDFSVSSKGLYRIQLEGDINDCNVILAEMVVLVL